LNGAKLIRRCHTTFRVQYYKMISSNTYIGSLPTLNQPVLFAGDGKISFEPNVTLGYPESPFFYNGYIYLDTRGKESEIKIGENTTINNNASLVADHARIKIGKNVLIGLSFEASTSDSHSLNPKKRLSPDYAKMNVTLEDNVFIGSNVIVLKGVSIGRNSVIGNGSIVTKSIPENVVAAGIPCRVIRKVPF
jgi:galactoside O-acetyltransferase